jgi:methionine-S-sulfoxide reductase
VKVEFDPSKVTYRQLLEGFFMMHDPTQLNRQGPDVGDQYRTAIFCTSPEQAKAAREYIAELADAKAFGNKPIVTQVVEPAPRFWAAEEYHQDYVDRTGRACHGINPWPQVLGTAPKAQQGAH